MSEPIKLISPDGKPVTVHAPRYAAALVLQGWQRVDKNGPPLPDVEAEERAAASAAAKRKVTARAK